MGWNVLQKHQDQYVLLFIKQTVAAHRRPEDIYTQSSLIYNNTLFTLSDTFFYSSDTVTVDQMYEVLRQLFTFAPKWRPAGRIANAYL